MARLPGRVVRGIGRTARSHPRTSMALASPFAAAGLVGLAGVGAAASAIHGMRNPDEKHTPWLDAAFEGILGDPQADRAILGRDIGMGTLLGLPPVPHVPFFSEMNTIRNLASNQTMGYVGAMGNYSDYGGVHNVSKWAQRVGGGDYPGQDADKDFGYSNYDQGYAPRATRRNMGATGDIVFGSYNLRHG